MVEQGFTQWQALLSALQNLVSNLSTVTQAINRSEGMVTSITVTTPTVVALGPGRLVGFSVTVAGSGDGTINDAATAAAVTDANVLAAAPMTLGVYQCGMAFKNGLVITPGSGQSLNATFYLGY